MARTSLRAFRSCFEELREILWAMLKPGAGLREIQPKKKSERICARDLAPFTHLNVWCARELGTEAG